MVSMRDSSVVSSMTLKDGRSEAFRSGSCGSRTPARAAHFIWGRLRSASMQVTEAPRRARQVMRRLAEVDFPTPPLGDAITMVGKVPPDTDD